jgi:hypothetical protein
LAAKFIIGGADGKKKKKKSLASPEHQSPANDLPSPVQQFQVKIYFRKS